MKLKLVEPLRELFRMKCACWVMSWACRMRLSGGSRSRSGLAIRVLGAGTKERLAILRGAKPSSIRRSAAGLYREIWQAFAVLLPIRTVGVMGDQRNL